MGANIISAIARLQDPEGFLAENPRLLGELQDKISSTMTRLFRLPENGGNPFLFALAGPKPHFIVKKLGNQEIDTAATDGKRFFWNPDWLAQLDCDQVATVMMHESYHMLFFHCDPGRNAGKDQSIWNYAIDYIVNGVIVHDHEKSGRSRKVPLTKIYCGALGTPVPLKEYLEWIDGKNTKDLPKPLCFTDELQHGRSPESIYDEIMKHHLSSPRRCKEQQGGCGAMSIDPKTGISTLGPGPFNPALPIGEPWGPGSCPKCGAPPNFGVGSMDSHLRSESTKDEVMSDMMRASEQASQMRGTTPAEIEAMLKELQAPTLSPRDIIRHCFQRKAQDVGNLNDWKRFRRRQLAMNPRMYLPRKHDFSPRMLAGYDCSGSMSDADIANGVKEIQAALAQGNAEAFLVPWDAKVYWDKMIRVTDKTQVKNAHVCGRGGTTISLLLTEYRKHVPDPEALDLIMVITDGYVEEIDPSLRPPCDCLFLVTNKEAKFKPPFGRVIHLKGARS